MIHIAAKDLGMDDSTYRDMLWSVGRVRSAKDLDAGGREAVINHMKRCGWQRKPETATRYKRGTPAALIRWLWTQLADAGLVENRSDRALRRYIGNHAGLPGRAGTEIAPQHLDRREAGQVIEQLKRWLARKEEGNA
ncbi:MAG TPA: regulatory protein GemA [Xanthomonadaceae bacterium]|nr:regulatory protein GemA [Xanthomonadaceae bacterium]